MKPARIILLLVALVAGGLAAFLVTRGGPAPEQDAEILRIGKTLTSYNRVDTGVFLASPALAVAIREAIAEGKQGSLSDGVQRLADQGEAWTADVTGLRWLDVDEPRFHEMAEMLVANDDLRDI